MINVHLYPSNFSYENRIEKQALFLKKTSYFQKIYLIGLGKGEFLIKKNLQVKLFGIKNTRNNFIIKIISFILYYLNTFLFLKDKKVYLINAHSVSVLPLAFFIKFFKNSKIVYDPHELETEKENLKGLKKKIFKLIEKKFIYSCELIFVVSDLIADWYAENYKIKRPIVIKNIPNYKNIKKNDIIRKKLGICSSKRILLYQGGLNKVKGIQYIIDAFKDRNKKNINDIVFVLMGFGELKNDILEAEKNFDNIYFLPAVNSDQILNYTSSADIGILLPQNTCLNNYYCLPNKLFEYAMAGLPVIVSDMKEMENVVKKNNFGLVSYDNSIREINSIIDEMIYRTDLLKFSNNAKSFSMKNSWEFQEKILKENYKMLLNK